MTHLRVVHVTEASAGGVLQAILIISQSQRDAGGNPELIIMSRPETEDDASLAVKFGDSVRYRRVSGQGLIGACRLAAAIWKLRREKSTVIHAHSSKAGAIVRAIAFAGKFTGMVIYSPHGFAFLRTDVPPIVRRIYRFAERILAHGCSLVILASASEFDAARRFIRADQLAIVENGVPVSLLPIRNKPVSQVPVVATLGRVAPQKRPDLFGSIARELIGLARFVWIGGGDDSEAIDDLKRSGVEVTGWAPRDFALQELANADVFVLTSDWEGMPLALIEAQCIGLPAVVTNVVGNIDVVIDGQTGLIATDRASLVASVRALLDDSNLRNVLSVGAVGQRERFDSARIGIEMYAQYERTVASRRSRSSGH